jgi:hypothetical protein
VYGPRSGRVFVEFGEPEPLTTLGSHTAVQRHPALDSAG